MKAKTLGTSMFIGVALLLCVSTSDGLSNGSGSMALNAGQEVILVDCAGRYIRFDSTTGSILAEGGLWDDSSMSDLRLNANGGFDGCLIADIQSDTRHGVFYAVLTRQPHENSDGQRRYVVVALDLQKLIRLAQFELETPIQGGVRILLSPDGQELIVSYTRYEEAGGQDGWHNLLERFSAPSLTRIKIQEDLRIDSASQLPSSMPLGNSASWIGGHRILNENLVLDDEGHVLEQLNPYSLLPNETAKQLAYLEKPGAPGRTYLPIAYADAAGGRVLFVAGHDLVPSELGVGSALWIYDVNRGASLRPIQVPETVAAYDSGTRETPTVHLTPNGDSILLESYEWRSGPSTNGNLRFKTGKLRLYDVVSGKLARTFNLEPTPGLATRLLGFSPDGVIAFIGSVDFIYAVPLDGSTPISVVRSTKGFNSFWTVGLAFAENLERPR
jgi:hypothetical protein